MHYLLVIGEAAAGPPAAAAATGWARPESLAPDHFARLAAWHGIAASALQPEPAPDAEGPGDLWYNNSRVYKGHHLETLAAYAGIEDLLFDPGYGLLVATPDVRDLRPEHEDELRQAYQAWGRAHPAGASALEDQVQALLAWLTFWVMYARDCYPHAVLASFDATGTAAARRL